MHENRETSESSRLNPNRDRSEKALCRTADRHVSEESDGAIVPVNLSNKRFLGFVHRCVGGAAENDKTSEGPEACPQVQPSR
jgi:hypothetical protein